MNFHNCLQHACHTKTRIYYAYFLYNVNGQYLCSNILLINLSRARDIRGGLGEFLKLFPACHSKQNYNITANICIQNIDYEHPKGPRCSIVIYEGVGVIFPESCLQHAKPQLDYDLDIFHITANNMHIYSNILLKNSPRAHAVRGGLGEFSKLFPACHTKTRPHAMNILFSIYNGRICMFKHIAEQFPSRANDRKYS